ncbi:MAG: autoinducer 2 ABC transporter substrate-binding protein [Armatimonadota bacterium]|nr:autoinducer 2 ABC transporter substrate-binding protein [Armatimonadota bacterium]
MKLRFIRILACATAALCILGCGKQQATNPQPHKRTIVFVFKEIGIPYANVCAQGARKAAKDLGINVEFLGPAKGADVAGQISILEAQIARGVDAIIVSPNDPNAVKPVVTKAMRKGIRVFTWDSDAPNTERIFYVAAADDVGIGEEIMDRLAKEIGGKGKVGIMSGGQGALNLNQHVEGVLRRMKQYPNIQLAKPIVYNNEQPQLAQSAVAGLLQKHPDLAGIACVNSPGPPGAARAVIAAGKAGKVKIWGLSLPSENRKYIKDGIVHGLILWDPAKLTYVTAKLVNDYLDGKKPVDGMEIKGVGKLRVYKHGVIIMPGVVITKKNVDSFDF